MIEVQLRQLLDHEAALAALAHRPHLAAADTDDVRRSRSALEPVPARTAWRALDGMIDRPDAPRVSEFRDAPALKPLAGDESLLDAAVADFWRWALSDLRMNTARGWFAEYLIARTVGDPRPGRTEWGSYDVESAEGIRIEVKSSGYWQSWAQKAPSSITFKGLRSRKWTPQTRYEPEPSIVADVFVFAVQAAPTADAYDPLDLTQWDFYVLPAPIIRERLGNSVGLATLRRLSGGPVKLDRLRTAIIAAAASS